MTDLAARALEQTRRRIADLSQRAARAENHIDNLDAEIERLRAALKEIAEYSPYQHSSTLRKKARAALAGEKVDD